VSVTTTLFLLLSLAPHVTALHPQDALEEARSLRREGRYSEALQRTADISDGAQRAFERLEVHYFAGDLGGALREALAGLGVSPTDRLLLWRAARLAIDLLATERAVLLAERLRLEILTAEDLLPQDREAWVREAGDLAREAADLQRTDLERGNALLRARVAVMVIGLSVLLAACWLSRSPRSG